MKRCSIDDEHDLYEDKLGDFVEYKDKTEVKLV